MTQATLLAYGTLLFFLLGAHAICDSLLQPAYMSRGKRPYNREGRGNRWIFWLGLHAAVHGVGVLVVTHLWPLALAEILAHSAIDTLKSQRVISMKLDQGLHVLCKLVWAALTILGLGVPA